MCASSIQIKPSWILERNKWKSIASIWIKWVWMQPYIIHNGTLCKKITMFLPASHLHYVCWPFPVRPHMVPAALMRAYMFYGRWRSSQFTRPPLLDLRTPEKGIVKIREPGRCLKSWALIKCNQKGDDSNTVDLVLLGDAILSRRLSGIIAQRLELKFSSTGAYRSCWSTLRSVL